MSKMTSKPETTGPTTAEILARPGVRELLEAQDLRRQAAELTQRAARLEAEARRLMLPSQLRSHGWAGLGI